MACEGDPVTSVAVPTRVGYTFGGYYDDATSPTTQYVDASGDFTAELTGLTVSQNTTFYAKWTQNSYTIIVDSAGGSGGVGAFYYVNGGFYADLALTEPITSVSLPVRSGYALVGLFASDGTTQRVAPDGTIDDTWTPTDDETITAQWVSAYTITVKPNGGTVGTSQFFHNPVLAQFYADASLTQQITSITPPTKTNYPLTGLYDNTTPNAPSPCVAASGAIDADWYPGGNLDITAQWGNRVTYTITLVKDGGTGGMDYVYGAVPSFGTGYYRNSDGTDPVTKLDMPTRTGYTLTGYWYSGGGIFADADGTIRNTSVSTTGAYSVTAVWTPNTYTLTFDAQGGTVSPASRTVTFDSAIGQMPTVSRTGYQFLGWYIGDTRITASTVWNVAGDAVAVAQWNSTFGDVTDFFGLASARLVPFESNEGLDRPHFVTRSYGKGQGASAFAAKQWRNPTVRYMVVGSGMVNVTLGSAWRGTTTKTGYMITGVRIETRIAEFPVVTVSAVANEGEPAKNTFNVSVYVLARARPQNLLNAIAGGSASGGELQSFTLNAVCDPVVLAANMEPCASDVVNGRYEMSAETLAPNLENPPSMAYDNFELTGLSTAKAGTDYTRYSITGRKEIY